MKSILILYIYPSFWKFYKVRKLTLSKNLQQIEILFALRDLLFVINVTIQICNRFVKMSSEKNIFFESSKVFAVNVLFTDH